MSLTHHMGELSALRRELEAVTADRVQLEALYATSRDEVLSLRTQVHALNNRLTAVILERDAARHEIHLYEVMRSRPKCQTEVERAT